MLAGNTYAFVILLFMMSLYAIPSYALEITRVSHDPHFFDNKKYTFVNINFSLSEPAKVILKIFDGRDLLMRKITSKSSLKAGDQKLTWDVKDQSGKTVPAEAYRYTLTATNKAGQSIEHDLTDLTRGKNIKAKDIKWDSKTKQIKYVLPKPGRVYIRLGLKNNGPFLQSLLGWVPRNSGAHTENWDGKDASGLLDLTNHPNLDIHVMAFEMSDNTIIIGPKSNQVNLVEPIKWAREERKVKRATKKTMYAYHQQSMAQRGDYKIKLVLPDTKQKNKSGLPVVSGKIPIRMEIDIKDQARALNRGFEVTYFLDGVYVYENEVGFFPFTWHWDTSKVNEGEHFISANLRGYEGSFGVSTIKVHVKR